MVAPFRFQNSRTCFVSRFLMQDASRKRLILREFFCWPSPSASVVGGMAPVLPDRRVAGGTSGSIELNSREVSKIYEEAVLCSSKFLVFSGRSFGRRNLQALFVQPTDIPVPSARTGPSRSTPGRANIFALGTDVFPAQVNKHHQAGSRIGFLTEQATLSS